MWDLEFRLRAEWHHNLTSHCYSFVRRACETYTVRAQTSTWYCIYVQDRQPLGWNKYNCFCRLFFKFLISNLSESLKAKVYLCFEDCYSNVPNETLFSKRVALSWWPCCTREQRLVRACLNEGDDVAWSRTHVFYIYYAKSCRNCFIQQSPLEANRKRSLSIWAINTTAFGCWTVMLSGRISWHK